MFLLFITLFGQLKLEKYFSCLSSQNLLLLNVTAFAFKLPFFFLHMKSLMFISFCFFLSCFPIHTLLIYLQQSFCSFYISSISSCLCKIIIFWPCRKRWYQGKEELLQQISLTKEISDNQKDHATGRGKNYWKINKDIRNHLKWYKGMIAKSYCHVFRNH